MIQSVFMALPITRNLGEDGLFKPDRKRFYMRAIEALRRKGWAVLCPCINEDWGRIKLAPEAFTEFDVESIQRSDCLVAVSSEGLSRDMYLEIGIACGLGKPVAVVVQKDASPTFVKDKSVTYMLLGLESLRSVRIVYYSGESDLEDVISALEL